jgi:hypothetical protein
MLVYFAFSTVTAIVSVLVTFGAIFNCTATIQDSFAGREAIELALLSLFICKKSLLF